MATLDPFVTHAHIAYFSMEIALHPDIHTYSGGLGVLAGDTVRSCADLALPVVFVTLASRAGYFRQSLDGAGRQVESPDWWQPEQWCEPQAAMTAVNIGGHQVWVRAWLYVHASPQGGRVPVLLLDTDLEQNRDEDRTLTHHLYGGDEAYRLKQEIVLGLGGIRLLRALGFTIGTYHLNEGHAALLTLDLLKRHGVPPADVPAGAAPYDVRRVRELCIFTTHTPVEAGHDQFAYDMVERLLPGAVDTAHIRQLAGRDHFNLTRLALNLSGYVNGVARRHAETTRRMFPGYVVQAITNGVHVGTWAHPAFARLYDRHFPTWHHEPEILVRALHLPAEEIAAAHREAKAGLVAHVAERTGARLDPQRPILGYARRMTGYKRPMLLFSDLERLAAIAERHPFQVVLAGKAHPRDEQGKQAIQRIVELGRELDGRLTCVFVPGYDMRLASHLVAGVDVWLNTPMPPLEASGTSGMKAALNAVLNLSVLDGWWIEACIEGVTGWAIGEDGEHAAGEHETGRHAAALYDKLEHTVLPLYDDDPAGWQRMMRHAIAHVASYFNSQRMMRRYAAEAYLR